MKTKDIFIDWGSDMAMRCPVCQDKYVTQSGAARPFKVESTGDTGTEIPMKCKNGRHIFSIYFQNVDGQTMVYGYEVKPL